MTEDEFVAEVARRANLDENEARHAVRATLRALARRLPADVPAEVVDHIPGRLGDIILPGHLPDGIPREGRGEVFDVVELYHRIARERDITAAKARKEAQAYIEHPPTPEDLRDAVAYIRDHWQRRYALVLVG